MSFRHNFPCPWIEKKIIDLNKNIQVQGLKLNVKAELETFNKKIS